MRREQIIQALEEAVHGNLTTANDLEAFAAVKHKKDFAASAAREVREAERCRWLAGCGMATINHLNGVSPE